MMTMKNNFMLTVLILFVILSNDLFAQLMTNDNVAITIGSGVQLTVLGDVQNQNGATINNSGTISLTGNWIHNAVNNCFGTSAGTVLFNGSNQTIGGSNSTLFNNLTFQGSGTKTLLINTTTGGSAGAGALNIGSRVLDLNSHSLTISNSATSAIAYTTGSIKSEQVNNSSKVTWTMGTTTGAHTIPFGTAAGTQIPLVINLTAGSIGNVTASTYPTAANNTPFPSTPVAVTNLNNFSGVNNSANTVDRFWEIDKSGASGTVTLTFNYAAAEQAANGNNGVRAKRWNSSLSSWEYALPSQTNPTSTSVTVPSVTNYGAWALGMDSTALSLKVFLEGYYTGGNTMSAVLFNNHFSTDPTACDSVRIELHPASNPETISAFAKTILHTNGNAQLIFPPYVVGNAYYLVIRHRNSLETWSKNLILFNSPTVNIDFSTP